MAGYSLFPIMTFTYSRRHGVCRADQAVAGRCADVARSPVDDRVCRPELPDELQLFFDPRFRAGTNEGYSVEVDGVLPKVRTPLRSQERGCLGLTPEDFDCVDVTVLSKANSLVGAIVDHVSLVRLQGRPRPPGCGQLLLCCAPAIGARESSRHHSRTSFALATVFPKPPMLLSWVFMPR
jgi:hypothetical protein